MKKNNLVSISTATTNKPLPTTEQRFKQNVGKPNASGCQLWQGAAFRSGYGLFKADGQNLYAHRVALQIASGEPIPGGKYVLHAVHCTSRLCCNPDHLRLGTAKENAQDRITCGRSGLGLSRPVSRLTEEERTKIAKMVLEGRSQYSIAKALNRTEPVIAYHLKSTNQKIAKKLHGKADDITKALTALSSTISDLFGDVNQKKAA